MRQWQKWLDVVWFSNMDCPNISAESCSRSNLIFIAAFSDNNNGMSESTTSIFLYLST